MRRENIMLPTKSIKLVLFLPLAIFLTHCTDDFFELKRPSQNPWSTVKELERAPVGAYGVLFSSREWVQAWPNYAVIITTLGDDITNVNTDEWGYFRNTQAGTDLSNRNIWLIYRGIAAANVALDYIEANDGNPYPDATNAELENGLKRIVGELHFIRGFSYYMLQTTFGHAYIPGGDNSTLDLPIRTHFVETLDDAVSPEIGSTQAIWDLIVSDFTIAKENLPLKYIQGLHDPSYQVRANKFAASAMLMRSYFQMGEYTLAKEESDFIINENGGAYDLSEDPIEAFNKSGFAERGSETIWYLPFSDVTLSPPSHMSVLNATWNSQKCNWNETRMALKTIKRLGWMNDPLTDTTINLEAKRDKRFQQLIKVRYPRNKVKPGQEVDDRPEISNITTVWPFKYYRGPGDNYTNLPLIRLAEIYLTRSIIKFNAGDKQGAAEDLNVVRKRAWDETLGGPYVDVTSTDITADMIHDERLIELFNEADRVNYLRGLKLDIPEGDRGTGSDPYTSDKFIWEIPLSETLYNGNLR